MRLHRRRRAAVGMVLVVVVAGAVWLVLAAAATPSTARASASPSATAVLGAVDAAGNPTGPAGPWQVSRSQAGVYHLAFAEPMDVALRSWGVAASVTLRPLPGDRWSVTFVAGNEPVDAAFSFVASPAAVPS